MKNGIRCLARIDKPVYAVLGNHDIENCEVMDEMASIDLETKDKRRNWNTENYVDVRENNRFWNVGTFYGLHFIRNQILFLFIDTNLFVKEKNCYHERERDIEEECRKMLTWVDKEIDIAIDHGVKHIVLTGHEPLFAYKLQKQKR